MAKRAPFNRLTRTLGESESPSQTRGDPAPPSQWQWEVGQAIGDYLLERRLGAGGMGEVWCARDQRFGNPVAIKRLSPRLTRETEFQERFLREAKAMANLVHPYIVQVQDYAASEDDAFLVMPYIAGGSLQDLLNKRGSLSRDKVLQISREVLDALDYAHKKGIIHRDVKPSNILMSEDGHAILTDFGISLMLGEERLTRVTRNGTPIGTPEYMSPERIQAPGEIDHRADVYGFGCVLYEMLTGQPPFGSRDKGDTEFTIMERHTNKPPPSLRGLNPEVDRQMESVVLKALAKRPDERFSRCATMAQALPGDTMPRRRLRDSRFPNPFTNPTVKGIATLGSAIATVAGTIATIAVLYFPHDDHPPKMPHQPPIVEAKPIESGVTPAHTVEPHEQAHVATARLPDRKPPSVVTIPTRQATPATVYPAGTVFRDTLKDGSKGPEMVVIPAGSFQMGDIQGKGDPDERPVHPVRIKEPFAMGRHEVTFAEYVKFAQAAERTIPHDRGWGRGNRPVIGVSWDDAQAYAKWLRAVTGKHYRLPTEAEWEYAARAGTETRYWWGDEVGKGNANCDGCGSEWDGKQTAPVGRFPANRFGLFDTAGNVYEWVQDCWHDSYKGAPTDGHKAWGSENGGECGRRVVRGGSWNYTPRHLRSATRGRNNTAYRNYDLGFRLAQDL
jgi:formylglycine-generating enzyme required for sulfatase activity